MYVLPNTGLVVPSPGHVSDRDLHDAAQHLRAAHLPCGPLPVNAEHIADVGLKLDIVQLEGLVEIRRISAFLSRDRRTIYLDAKMVRESERRTRYTIAHELGHYALHERIYRAAGYRNPEDCLDFRNAISERSLARYEYQANQFARCLLVSRKDLRVRLATTLAVLRRDGYGVAVDDPGDRAYVERELAVQFAVSTEVISHRMRDEGLWASYDK